MGFFKLQQYQYYSASLLSNHDKFHEHQIRILGPKEKFPKEMKKRIKGIVVLSINKWN